MAILLCLPLEYDTPPLQHRLFFPLLLCGGREVLCLLSVKPAVTLEGYTASISNHSVNGIDFVHILQEISVITRFKLVNIHYLDQSKTFISTGPDILSLQFLPFKRLQTYKLK